MSPERDDYEDDEERDDYASRSIFSAGWFRAVLVLTVLAIVVVISLPYLLNWFESSPPARVTKAAEPLSPAPSAAPPPAITPAPAPAPDAPIAAPPGVKPVPPAPGPAPKAGAEKARPPAPSETALKGEREKGPARAAAAPAPARATSERPAAKPAEKAPVKTADGPAAPTRVAAKTDAPSRPAALAGPKPSAETAAGNYWIQLGAFKEPRNAAALAKALRDAGFPVQVTSISPGRGGESTGAAQQHELFVTETSAEKVNAALKGRGTAQVVSGGIAVKPSFSLQEAMTVSKRLTDQGLKVVIRPAGGSATPASGPGTLHAVRAGGYPNRTRALAARDELSAKGHQGFLAEGPAK